MMYTEVIQTPSSTSCNPGKCRFASGGSLTLSQEKTRCLRSNIEYYRSRIVLRPQEISNSPGTRPALGLITINTALELGPLRQRQQARTSWPRPDEREFRRLGATSTATPRSRSSTCPSIAKGGQDSATIGRRRARGPQRTLRAGRRDRAGRRRLALQDAARARCAHQSRKCVHPEYSRHPCRSYLALSNRGHVPQTLNNCFRMHRTFLEGGDMRKVEWSK